MDIVVVANKNYEFTTEFNDEQLEQISLSKDHFKIHNSEILKHPEWSSTFMNFYINREAKGEDTAPLFVAADYLKRHRLPCDVKGKQIGNTIDGVHCLLEAIELGIDIENITPMKDGMIDYDMWIYMLMTETLKKKGSEVLLSGRVCLTGNVFMDEEIMAEGLPEAKDICSKLCSYSANSKSPSSISSSDDPFARMGERAWKMESILLMLDDMGIRGKQLLDAVEYAGGTAQDLYKILDTGRSQELVDYVNMKSALRIKEGESNKEYIAVTHGSSFDKENNDALDRNFPSFMNSSNKRESIYKYRMDKINYEEYIDLKVAAKEIDYSKLDIVDNTDTATAIKIAEARGFQTIRRFNKGKTYGDEDTEYILMFSPETGALFNAQTAVAKNICYGGCYLRVLSNECVSWDITGPCSRGSIGDPNKTHLFKYEWTEGEEGLFSSYDKLSKEFFATGDKLKEPAKNMDSLSIPQYVPDPHVKNDAFGKKVSFDVFNYFVKGMGNYYFNKMVNYILMHYDEELFKSECPVYTQFKDEDFYLSNMADVVGASSVNDDILAIRLAFKYLQMPDEEIQKCINAMKESLGICNGSLHENTEKEIEAFDKKSKILIKGFKQEDKLLDMLNLPALEYLPVSLPWVEKEKMEEMDNELLK